MKTVLIIGLGRFGSTMAMKLHELGHEVMAIDSSEDRINAVLPYVTSAQIGDCANEQYMNSLGRSEIIFKVLWKSPLFLRIWGQNLFSPGQAVTSMPNFF